MPRKERFAIKHPEFNMIVRMTIDGEKHDASFSLYSGNGEFCAMWLPCTGEESDVAMRDVTACGAVRKLYAELRRKNLIGEVNT